jgi:RNA polymerase sigma-70 factor (ECF subfamily)
LNRPYCSEEQLIEHLRAGDVDAFEEIYRRYWRRLYAAARQKVYETEVVEELLQDLFTRLWERRETLLVAHLEAYLFTALKYGIVKHIRSKMVRERYTEYALLNQPAGTHSTEEDISLHELTLALSQSIAALPEKTRTIFQLHRLKYKPVKEIATLLQIPERTVEYHLHKAVGTLRVYLQDFLVCLLALDFLFGN